VLEALDTYLAVSPSKLLAVLPLRDERERDHLKASCSALIIESFEPPAALDGLLDRAQVLGRHAAGALYNAAEYRRIPLPWLWMLWSRWHDGLGARTWFRMLFCFFVAAGLATALVAVPYPLKLEAKGQLLPELRRWVYSPVEGQIIRFEDGVEPGSQVAEGQALILMHDVQLEIKLVQLNSEIDSAQQAIEALVRQQGTLAADGDAVRLMVEKKQKEYLRDRKVQERQALCQRIHGDAARPGSFWVNAPLTGTILNSNFRETLTSRLVKPMEPLLRIGDESASWELELKIPQEAIGQVVEAQATAADGDLDVDLKLLSCPTRTFKGKLARSRITRQAIANRDNAASPEPAVLASVRLVGPDLEEAAMIPKDLLIAGTEVHVRICCGHSCLGYSLFHGIWEFVNEKFAFF
jgi:hypothetical protein